VKQFVNLHAHSSYSQLDGASKISEYVARVKELGMPSAGISDHGNLSGIIDFYKECKKQEVRPVLGIEAYFTDNRFLREGVKQEDANGEITGSDKRYYHLSVYAENNEGYHNLLKLSSDSYLNGFYHKARADYSSLAQYSKGLIVGSGCLGGPVLQPLLNGNFLAALDTAQRLQDIVGKDNFFIELMNHGLPEQKKTNPLLLDIAKRIGAQAYASQDSHYTHKHDAPAHEILLCCSTGSQLSDPKRFHFHNDEYYLKSSEEMRTIFADNEEVCDNTLVIAERCNVDIDFDSLHLPQFPVPEGFKDDVEYLVHLVVKGIQEKFPNASEEVWERAEYELGVFQSMGVSSYMLIIWDIIEFAKREGMFISPGRGSVAGCFVAYLLGITKVDPLKYGLIFERFLNPSRIALPDVDLDLEQRYREKVINYTIDQYGRDFVAQITTFNTIKARTAVRDAARVLGHPPQMGNQISKLMPQLISGVDTPLWACLEKSPKYEQGYHNAQGLRDLYNSDNNVKIIIDAAVGIEGLIKSSGKHAAAVVIGDRPLNELVPLMYDKDGGVVIQWGKKTVEALGLVKMDYLGLKNLDILSDTQALIRKDDPSFDIDELPMDDPETYGMLREGFSLGCFQIEGSGMRELLKRLKPSGINDLSAVLALYRPGPMASNWHNDYADRKNGRQVAIPFHEDARDILESTYQLCIYQEQILKIANKFAGYSLTEADNLRKIIGKKEIDEMKAESGKFIDGCIDQGYEPEMAQDLFHALEGFSAYGFNSAHSMAYAFISYWTAYLKKHYPREYMASLCSAVMDDLDSTAVYLNEARRMGLAIYPPDLNTSATEYTVESDGIRIGLNTLKNVGEAPTVKIIEERTIKPFDSLYDFAYRVNPNVKTLRSLAWAGALDQYGTRQGIGIVAEDILKATRKERKKSENQLGLFEEADVGVDFQIPNTEFQWHEFLNKEKETLGLYVSGHPLSDYGEYKTDVTISDIKSTDQNKSFKVLAMINTLEIKYTKKQEIMAILSVEDETGTIEVVVFPSQYTKACKDLIAGAIAHLWIRPGSDYRDEKNYILGGAEGIKSKIQVATDERFGVFLPRGLNRSTEHMGKLKAILLQNKGRTPIDVYISRSTTLSMEDVFLVDDSEKFRLEIKNLFIDYASI